jgi:hypothetical protein
MQETVSIEQVFNLPTEIIHNQIRHPLKTVPITLILQNIPKTVANLTPPTKPHPINLSQNPALITPKIQTFQLIIPHLTGQSILVAAKVIKQPRLHKFTVEVALGDGCEI